MSDDPTVAAVDLLAEGIERMADLLARHLDGLALADRGVLYAPVAAVEDSAQALRAALDLIATRPEGSILHRIGRLELPATACLRLVPSD